MKFLNFFHGSPFSAHYICEGYLHNHNTQISDANMYHIMQQKVIFQFLKLVMFVILSKTTYNQAHAEDKSIKARTGEWVRQAVPELSTIVPDTVVLKAYPVNDNWEILKRFNGEAVFTFLSPTSGRFYFTFAGKDDKGKIVLVNIYVEVSSPTPVPPTPVPPTPVPPTPVPPTPVSPYSDTFTGLYLSFPDPDALTSLISIFAELSDQIKRDQLASPTALATTLKALSKDKLKPEQVVKLRAAISAVLLKEIPPTIPWAKAKSQQTIDNVLIALKAILNVTKSPIGLCTESSVPSP